MGTLTDVTIYDQANPVVVNGNEVESMRVRKSVSHESDSF